MRFLLSPSRWVRIIRLWWYQNAMLVPLMFAILPTTIAFAIFPEIVVLQLGL